jgi:ubiquinone biosynthesis protein COQ9
VQAGEGAAHIARHTQQGSEANSTEETKENKTMFVNFEIDLLPSSGFVNVPLTSAENWCGNKSEKSF